MQNQVSRLDAEYHDRIQNAWLFRLQYNLNPSRVLSIINKGTQTEMSKDARK